MKYYDNVCSQQIIPSKDVVKFKKEARKEIGKKTGMFNKNEFPVFLKMYINFIEEYVNGPVE